MLADVVPTVPWRSLGFVHPLGEIHIMSPGRAVSCPGASSALLINHISQALVDNDDATDWQCQIQTVPTVLRGSIIDHVSRENEQST
jgi:hypothetical protein